MTNKIKFLIIIALSFLMIQAVSASDDVVSAPNNEVVTDVVVDEIIEVYGDDETILSLEGDEEDDSAYDDLYVAEDSYPQYYNDSDIIINYYEKSLEVENSENQYNNTYIMEILVDSLNSTGDLNYTEFISCHIVDNFLSDAEISICMILENEFNEDDLSCCGFKLEKFDENNILTHDILIFNNIHANVLVHAVNKNTLLCNDKLNSKFVFCIDNSIVGSANKFNIFNLLIIYYSPLSFSQYFSTSFYSIGCVYDFFPLFYNQINEVYSFRI